MLVDQVMDLPPPPPRRTPKQAQIEDEEVLPGPPPRSKRNPLSPRLKRSKDGQSSPLHGSQNGDGDEASEPREYGLDDRLKEKILKLMDTHQKQLNGQPNVDAEPEAKENAKATKAELVGEPVHIQSTFDPENGDKDDKIPKKKKKEEGKKMWSTNIIDGKEKGSKDMGGDGNSSDSELERRQSIHAVLCDIDPDKIDEIYSKNYYSLLWVIISVIVHVTQFSLLMEVAKDALSNGQRVGLICIATLVPICLLSSIPFVTIKKVNARAKYRDKLTPDDETDDIQDIAIWLLVTAVLLEAVSFAALTAACSNTEEDFEPSGFRSQQTMIQILQFGAITFYSFHRCIRPANRCDPLRTMNELEVVSICWDALDGATIFALMNDLHNKGEMTTPVDYSLRFLLVWWYLSVGARVSVMFISFLPASSWGYKQVMPPPLKLAPEPVVDRTLQALRNRSLVTTVMSLAQFYAAGLRIALWSRHQLDQLQIEMCIKNLAFLYSIYGASEMYNTTKRRDWNTREIVAGLEYPSRLIQLQCAKYVAVTFYLVVGVVINLYLAEATGNDNWYASSLFDFVLCALFMVYCDRAYRKDTSMLPKAWYWPQDGHVIFPKKLGAAFSIILAANLYMVRIPAIYNNYHNFYPPESGETATYTNALVTLSLSVLVIGAFSMFWYLSNMMFHREFTASPGDYNSIHDPLINMVSMTTQIEGAMDVLSCIVLMQLAAYHIPDRDMNNAIIMFSLFEILNACICFAMQAFLSSGADDTPKDLIKIKAYMRGVRAFIDFGVFILRMVLWIRYNALTSVFLVKNLYNLIHTLCQIERYFGVKKYPKYTLFTEAVPSYEWYGMSSQEWRKVAGGHR